MTFILRNLLRRKIRTQLTILGVGGGGRAKLSAPQLKLVNAQQALDELNKHAPASTALAQQVVADAMQAVEDAQKDITKLDYRLASDELLIQTQDEIDLPHKQVSRAEDVFMCVKYHPDSDSLKAQAELVLIQACRYLDDRTALLNLYTGKPDDVDATQYHATRAEANLSHAQAEYERRKKGPDLEIASSCRTLLAITSASIQEKHHDTRTRKNFRI